MKNGQKVVSFKGNKQHVQSPKIKSLDDEEEEEEYAGSDKPRQIKVFKLQKHKDVLPSDENEDEDDVKVPQDSYKGVH